MRAGRVAGRADEADRSARAEPAPGRHRGLEIGEMAVRPGLAVGGPEREADPAGRLGSAPRLLDGRRRRARTPASPRAPRCRRPGSRGGCGRPRRPPRRRRPGRRRSSAPPARRDARRDDEGAAAHAPELGRLPADASADQPSASLVCAAATRTRAAPARCSSTSRAESSRVRGRRVRRTARGGRASAACASAAWYAASASSRRPAPGRALPGAGRARRRRRRPALVRRPERCPSCVDLREVETSRTYQSAWLYA